MANTSVLFLSELLKSNDLDRLQSIFLEADLNR